MEYWIEVKGHPRYLVSTLGRVKCVDYRGTGKERLCKLKDNGNGYLQVAIDRKLKYVHRLVLESFIPNPQNKPEVEHKDTKRDNNVVGNLKWVSHKENYRNHLTRKHMSENNAKPMLGKFGAEHNRSVAIVQLTLDGKFIKKWPAASEAVRELGINKGSICSCCKGKLNEAGGYKWVYAKNYNRTKKISEIKPLF